MHKVIEFIVSLCHAVETTKLPRSSPEHSVSLSQRGAAELAEATALVKVVCAVARSTSDDWHRVLVNDYRAHQVSAKTRQRGPSTRLVPCTTRHPAHPALGCLTPSIDYISICAATATIAAALV